jgi:hypothetical protein
MLVTPADDKGLDKVLKLIKMAPEELKLDIDWSNLSGAAPRREAPAREAPGREAPGREAPGREATGREAPARDESAREKTDVRGSSRGRARRSEAPSEGVATTEIAAAPAAPVVAAPAVAATDEAPARRTRSRRTRGGDKAVVVEPVIADARAETVVEAPVKAVVETARAEPAAPAEPRQNREPQLRQADRPGASKDRELPPAREGAGFGNDIPAFLRRPVPVRA